MLAAAGSIVVAVVLFAAATVVLVRHELRSSLDSALRQRATDVAELAVSAPAVLTYPGALESTASGREIAVEVIDAHGRILARSLSLGARLLPQDQLARQALLDGRPGYEDIDLAGRPLRIYDAPIAQAGGPAGGGAVLVASDTSETAHTLNRLGLIVALAGAGVTVLAVLAAAVLTRQGLGPLRRLVQAAGEIERTADPARGLPEARAPEEIGQLTGVLNRMLVSLEAARAGERRFLADASHEQGDREALTRVLENLIENAVIHGPPGGSVTVALRRGESTALLSVRDEGAGPDPAYGRQVFERFWRAPEASGRPGSGLGLSIVSAIVELHGGQITVQGSEFTVALPAVGDG